VSACRGQLQSNAPLPCRLLRRWRWRRPCKREPAAPLAARAWGEAVRQTGAHAQREATPDAAAARPWRPPYRGAPARHN